MRVKHIIIGLVTGPLLLLTGYVLGARIAVAHLKQQEIANELQSKALNTLGYLEYHEGNFKVTDSLKSEVQTLLASPGCSLANQSFSAYLYDFNNKKIVWNSIELQKNPAIQEQNLQTFNANLLANSEFNSYKAKMTEPKINILTNISDGAVNYLTGIQFLRYPKNSKTTDYIFVALAKNAP
ncbi:hypothetical protein [Thiofilum flexile]|uniref:hypothetical protein n=1 Tax=Thiofilum flexile TaxID=125627 RepID=UPI00035FC07D|nr:hypothetical protein [Thiofilum flexile]